MAWQDEKSSYLKIQEGEEKEFTVLTITEKAPTAKIKPLLDKTYYYEFETDLGVLTVNGLGFMFALTGAGVQEGDRIKVKYIKKGSVGNPSKYEVTMIKKAEEAF